MERTFDGSEITLRSQDADAALQALASGGYRVVLFRAKGSSAGVNTQDAEKASETAGVSDKTEARTLFDRIRTAQGRITPVAKSMKVDAFSFVYKGKEPRPALTGVYHDGGYVVGTDLYSLYARKEAYPKRLEGKIIGRDGVEVDAKYVDWRRMTASVPDTVPISEQIDTERLLGFVSGVFERMKTEGVKRREQDQAVVMLRSAEGKVRAYHANRLRKVLNGAKALGAHGVKINGDGILYAKPESGFVCMVSTGFKKRINFLRIQGKRPIFIKCDMIIR